MTSSRRLMMHVAVWLCVFMFWLLATRRFHPTLSIAVLATAVLVSASAWAVYVNRLFLLPRFARARLWWQYAASLLATVIILDLIAVLLIQIIYDRLWRPDPLRFGFWLNVASDGFIIVLHLTIAMGFVWIVRLFHRKTASQPIKD